MQVHIQECQKKGRLILEKVAKGKYVSQTSAYANVISEQGNYSN